MIKWRKTKEKVSETLENVETVQEETSESMAEEVMEEDLQDISQESVEEKTEETVEVSKGISEEELKEISEALEEETTEISGDDLDDAVQENLAEEIAEAFAAEDVEESTDEVTEEVSEEAEGETAEIETKKKTGKKAIIISTAVVAVLVAAYLGVAFYFSNYFLMKTSVNGVDCTGKTVKEVKNLMQSQVEKYSLTVEGKDGATEEIKGVDIGIKYIGADVIEEAFEKQNSYIWIVSIFKENNMKVAIDFEYDSAKLDEAISNLQCMKIESQVAPVSAIPVYQDGVYVIQEEVNGTQLHLEKVQELIHNSVDAMEEKANLEESNCYVLPTYTKDSAEVIAAKDTLNKCLETNITYSLEGITLAINKDMIQPWLSLNESMAVVVNADQVRAFVNTVGATFNTPNMAGEIVTPNGKVAHVPNGRLGRVVGVAAECEQLTNEILAGTQITREPVLSQRGTPAETTPWGATYVEVDITQQHMWYIEDGGVAFETDVVTGSPGRDTPVGMFTILEKMRNKILRGNIMPNGQREYETPVSYWARITWSGVGFHDATWQPAFGGELYRQGAGSHGCINMPLDAVAQFYEMISVGCPVILHY